MTKLVHNWKASLDRVLKILTGSKRVDRVPYFALIDEQMLTRINGVNVRTLYSSPEIYAKSALIATEFLNSDILALPTVYTGPVEAAAFAEVNNKGNCIKWFDYQPIFIDQGVICKTEEDIERLKIPDHSKNKLWNTTFEASKILYAETQFPQNIGLGIWSVVQQLRGVQAYRDMRHNPEILLTLCEKIYESEMDVVQNWFDKVGISPFIFYAGYAFNRTMMSFQDAMKYEGQFIKRMQKEIGIPFILHNCGMKPYFEEACREINFAAVNGSHPLDINFWINFKKQFPKVTIMGANIDVSQEMLTGTPADVEAKVKENIINLAPKGRYIVSPVCCLPFNLPLPNVMAVSSAIEKYGTYPIQEIGE
jgi:uroporphyrinogen-III decarboxylase